MRSLASYFYVISYRSQEQLLNIFVIGLEGSRLVILSYAITCLVPFLLDIRLSALLHTLLACRELCSVSVDAWL